MENNPTWLPVVAIALHDRHRGWLLHRRPDGKAHAGLWEFPGGKVEHGERPRAALVRECSEELGIIVDPTDLVPTYLVDEVSENPIVLMLYTCARWEGEPAALEGGAVDWFTPEGASTLVMPPLDQVLRSRLDAGRWEV